MHNFDELVTRCTAFTLTSLDEVNSKVLKSLETGASTIAVKNLQMIQLQKTILSIGMFSLFESILQDGLGCRNGFDEAKKILIKAGQTEIHEKFTDFLYAINVLKHGRGRSYEALLEKASSLPFRIKLDGESSFEEGDVAEIDTLIEVDDKFVMNCAELIEKVSQIVRIECPDYYL